MPALILCGKCFLGGRGGNSLHDFQDYPNTKQIGNCSAAISFISTDDIYIHSFLVNVYI